MADKPASRPFAKGLARGEMFVGQFALAGMVPELVKRQDGAITRFDTEKEAEVAASMALTNRLSKRTSQANGTKAYARLTGDELANLLATADVTPSAFARYYGVPRDRVLGWLQGAQDIPHAARVLARLLENAWVREQVEIETDNAIEEGAE